MNAACRVVVRAALLCCLCCNRQVVCEQGEGTQSGYVAAVLLFKSFQGQSIYSLSATILLRESSRKGDGAARTPLLLYICVLVCSFACHECGCTWMAQWAVVLQAQEDGMGMSVQLADGKQRLSEMASALEQARTHLVDQQRVSS